MANSENAILPLQNWQTNQLRLTAFPTLETVEVNPSSWGQCVIGEPPDIKELKPKLGEFREVWKVGSGQIGLFVDVNRIDWRLVPKEDPEGQLVNDLAATIGPYPDHLEQFLKLMSQWFTVEELPPVQRLAFGQVLLYPVETREEGYRKLAAFLRSIQIDPEGSSDLLYQINRPRQIEIDITDRRINRLSKWSVLRNQGSILRLTPNGIEEIPGKESFAIRLETDFNTSAHFTGRLPREMLTDIFNVLVHMSNEIVTFGDIA